MNFFSPKIEILPPAQKTLWRELGSVPGKFVLYGGTGLALRLGHRTSVDFDFFSSESLDRKELENQVPFIREAKVTDSRKNTLTIEVNRLEPVKVSFFGGLTFGRIGEPERTEDNRVTVASLADLPGPKLKSCRNERNPKTTGTS